MKKTFKHPKFTAEFTDENGYFSLTGNIGGSSGAVADEIAKEYPEFELVAKCHLANCKTGEPMNAWPNAIYHASQGGRDGFISMQKSLRCDNIDAEKIFAAIRSIVRLNPTKDERQEKFIIKAIEPYIEPLKEQWEEEAEEVYEIIEDTEANLVGTFIDPYTDEGDFITPEYEAHLDGMDEPEKAIAAAMQEDIDVLEVTEGMYGTYTAAGVEYLVLTDDEADQAWDEDLENYIDEYLEIPENIKVYFDREAWKKDARQDNRGHSLGKYDGNEYYQDVNGTTYYLYRQ